MKTDELVAMLASAEGRVPRAVPLRRLGLGLAAGAAVGALLMLLLLGVRGDLAADAHRPMLWLKFGFALLLAAGGFAVSLRASRPSGVARAGWCCSGSRCRSRRSGWLRARRWRPPRPASAFRW